MHSCTWFKDALAHQSEYMMIPLTTFLHARSCTCPKDPYLDNHRGDIRCHHRWFRHFYHLSPVVCSIRQ